MMNAVVPQKFSSVLCPLPSARLTVIGSLALAALKRQAIDGRRTRLFRFAL